jgi:hypothetical protein
MLQPLGEEAFALILDAPRKEGPWATHTYHLQPKRAKILQKLGSYNGVTEAKFPKYATSVATLALGSWPKQRAWKGVGQD